MNSPIVSIAISLMVGTALAIGFLFWMIASIRELYGAKPRRQGTIAIGNALQEMDRLVARPAIEFKIETESAVIDTRDDRGGG